MKKTVCIFLVLSICFSAIGIPTLAAQPETVTPLYENTLLVRTTMNMDSAGKANINIQCYGKSGTTSIRAETHLELKVGQSWVTIDNGQPNDQWTASTTDAFLIRTYEYQLVARGTYRAVTIFTVTKGTSEGIAVFSNEVTYTP